MVLVYEVTNRTYPQSEIFGITAQIRRAAISIPANIAEGSSRYSTRAYCNHINVALGSHGELRTLLDISSRLRYLTAQDTARLAAAVDEVGRMLSGLRKALHRRLAEPSSVPQPDP